MHCPYKPSRKPPEGPDCREAELSGTSCDGIVTNIPLSNLAIGTRSLSMSRSTQTRLRQRKGFSLIEIMVVISIMAVMTSLLLPAVGGFSSTAGRRGAVNIVMNTFEQARVAALESGQTVYVGFADGDFPVEDMRYSAFIVFRDATDEEKSAGKTFVVLKNWTRLPKNVAFKQIASSLVGSGAVVRDFTGLSNELGAGKRDERFPFVAFNSSGAIDEPASNLHVFLYEGYYAEGRENPVRNANNLFEKISLSRYTGRAQLDVTGTGT